MTGLTNISAVSIPRRMGRPPLSKKSDTIETKVRMTKDLRDRVVAVVGPTGMAQFIREAISRELARREKR